METSTETHLVRFISEEVDLLKLLVRDMLQAECLVPSVREDVKRDLAADGVRQNTTVRKHSGQRRRGESEESGERKHVDASEL